MVVADGGGFDIITINLKYLLGVLRSCPRKGLLGVLRSRPR